MARNRAARRADQLSQRALIDPTTFKGERPPDYVKEVRIDQVEVLMAAGVSVIGIAEHCRKEFGIAARTARDYQQTVRERWLAESTAARPELRRRIERMLELCYERAMGAGENHAAIRATIELARFHGLYRPGDAPDNREPDQHVHLHAHAHVAGLTPALGMTPLEREAEIKRLEEKRRLALGRPAVPARLRKILDAKSTP